MARTSDRWKATFARSARGGDAVVETANGVVLVPGALPGERVELSPHIVEAGRGPRSTADPCACARHAGTPASRTLCRRATLRWLPVDDRQRRPSTGPSSRASCATRAGGYPAPTTRRSSGSRPLPQSSDTVAAPGSRGTATPSATGSSTRSGSPDIQRMHRVDGSRCARPGTTVRRLSCSVVCAGRR